ncbi:MAG: Uncharacterized metal-dependent hydrolase YcfH, partial [uncultured Solirubrobacteraceae bacterium]
DRRPHAPGLLRPARRRARGGGPGGRGDEDPDRRHRRAIEPQRAGGGRRVRRGVGSGRAAPEQRSGLRRRRARGSPRPRGAPTLRRDRRDRPGLLPRRRAAGGADARVPRAGRTRARGRQAAGDPHPCRGRRHDHAAQGPRRRRARAAALLLDGRPGRRVRPGGLVVLVRRERHLSEERRPGRRRPARARRPAARRDRRAVPHAAGCAQAPERPGLRRSHGALRRGGAPGRVRGARGAGGGQRRGALRLV